MRRMFVRSRTQLTHRGLLGVIVALATKVLSLTVSAGFLSLLVLGPGATTFEPVLPDQKQVVDGFTKGLPVGLELDLGTGALVGAAVGEHWDWRTTGERGSE